MGLIWGTLVVGALVVGMFCVQSCKHTYTNLQIVLWSALPCPHRTQVFGFFCSESQLECMNQSSVWFLQQAAQNSHLWLPSLEICALLPVPVSNFPISKTIPQDKTLLNPKGVGRAEQKLGCNPYVLQSIITLPCDPPPRSHANPAVQSGVLVFFYFRWKQPAITVVLPVPGRGNLQARAIVQWGVCLPCMWQPSFHPQHATWSPEHQQK